MQRDCVQGPIALRREEVSQLIKILRDARSVAEASMLVDLAGLTHCQHLATYGAAQWIAAEYSQSVVFQRMFRAVMRQSHAIDVVATPVMLDVVAKRMENWTIPYGGKLRYSPGNPEYTRDQTYTSWLLDGERLANMYRRTYADLWDIIWFKLNGIEGYSLNSDLWEKDNGRLQP